MNQSSYYGRIFVSSDSTILSKENYGDVGKDASQFGCDPIFKEGSNSTCARSGNCDDYLCTKFSEPVCKSQIDDGALNPGSMSASMVPSDPDPATNLVPEPTLVDSASSSLSLTVKSSLITLLLTVSYLVI